MDDTTLVTHQIKTVRHRASWIEVGPTEGPLMIFIHGSPEIGLLWRAQVEHFAAAGWRGVAPEMRGYGGLPVPNLTAAHTVREMVADMVELHAALSGRPAIYVGHDWGSPVVRGLATHHPERCRAVANLCVPHIAQGFALPSLMPQEMFDTLVGASERTGFGGGNDWYLNDAANIAYAAEAAAFGRIDLPVLFLHAEWDTLCDAVRSRLADPMREDCTDLDEVTIAGGHMLMLERPGDVNVALAEWLAFKNLSNAR